MYSTVRRSKYLANEPTLGVWLAWMMPTPIATAWGGSLMAQIFNLLYRQLVFGRWSPRSWLAYGLAAPPKGLPRRRALLLALLWSLPAPAVILGEDLVTANPGKVEAAFLRNFAHYVTWPTNVFANAAAPWRVGILGDDPFGAVLEKTFQGRSEQGRSFEIVRAASLDKLPPCQIVFIAYTDTGKRRAALQRLRGRPVLTVADATPFLQEGGIIRFDIKDRVEMSVNLDGARAASLGIQTKLLEVSREVLENGALRKLR
ncbi:MAG TPA: YfiR family protein [Verrucomicrobiae bacterium]